MEHDVEECVKRLHLEPGDVLVLRTTERVTRDGAERIRLQVEKAIPGHKCLVLDRISLEVLKP